MLISRRQFSAGLAGTIGTATFGHRRARAATSATLASILARDHLLTRSFNHFVDRVREGTGGSIDIAVIDSGQLGGLKETAEAAISGNLEFTQVNNALLGSFLPQTMLFDLPFLFQSNEHMKNVVRGPIGNKVYGAFEAATGLKILMGGLPDGPRSVWNSKRAIYEPGDLRGLRIRILESAIMTSTFEALGTIPVPMPFPEVYMAAQQGVIDGAETPAGVLLSMRVPEIAKYYSLTKHVALPAAIAVNVEWFNTLTDAERDAIVEASVAARAWYDSEYDRDEARNLAGAAEEGLSINEVNDLSQFRDAVTSVYDTYKERVGGQGAIEEVLGAA